MIPPRQAGGFRLLPCLIKAAPLCLCLFYLAPFIYAYAFCRPAGDDYDGITRAMFLFDLPGALYNAGREWLSWSGRWAYHFLSVFLGRAAENPFALGLACLCALSAFPIAFCRLARSAGLDISQSLCFACASLCALMGFHANLPDFYLLTDALTIVLQAGLYFLFLSGLIAMLGAPRDPGARRLCVICGLLAEGVYEHAALAVFWTMAAAFALLFLYGWRDAAFNERKKSLINAASWLFGGLALSFLAPGNFARAAARGAGLGERLANPAAAPGEWLNFAADFFLSPWPLAALCLAGIARLYSPLNPSFRKPGACLVLAPAFTFFSFSLIILHALSDVPFSQERKLAASLQLYAAAAFGFCVFFAPGAAGLARLIRPAFAAAALFAALAAMLAMSPNFQKTAANAANGSMLIYASFMKEREAWLKLAARQAQNPPDRFGLIGELLKPGVRKRELQPEMGAALLPAYPRHVFPVYTGLGLSSDPAGWPNLWAAWVWGIGSAAEIPPDGAAALAAAGRGERARLAVPKKLAGAGLAKAWLCAIKEDAGLVCSGLWLVLEAAGPLRLNILLPAKPDRLRLAPFFWQKKAFALFEEGGLYKRDFFTPYCATSLDVSLEKGLRALWLGPVSADLPRFLFASAGAPVYAELAESADQGRGRGLDDF